MVREYAGCTAVIFVSKRNGIDAAGYDRAASDMEHLARAQPGFVAIDSVRGADCEGITISYWANEEAAAAWRDHRDHVRIREAGRDRWYHRYSVTVAQVTRAYDWHRP